MNNTLGSSLMHTGLARPRPRKTQNPTRARLGQSVVRDSLLDTFFPKIPRERPGDVPTIPHEPSGDIDGPSETFPEVTDDAPSNQCCVDERSRATLKTLPQPLPLGKQHRAEGRDSGDAAAGVGSYGNAACIGGGGVSWSSSGEAAGRRNDEDTAEEMKRTLGRRHQELEDDEGREKRKLRVMKQLQEEPVSGLVTTKGRSVQSLVVYLSDRIHMYSPSNTSVSGSPLARCQSEDEVDYHRSPDLDSPLDSGDSSTSDESSADEESIADDECSVGENSLSEDESISDDESNAGEESNINNESFIDNESNAGNEYIDGSFLDDNIFDEAENAAFTLKQVNEDTHLSSINAQTRATSTLGQHPSEAASDREPGNMTEGILTRAKLLSDSLEASGKRPSEHRMTTLVTGYTGTTKKSPNDNISENSVNDEITAHEKSQGEDKLIIGQLPKEVCGDSASLGQPEAEGETPETLQVLLAETIIHSATPITQTETAAREDLETASLMDDETKDVYNISLKETESSSVTLRRNKVANYSSAPPKPPRARISGFPSTILKDTCSRFQEIPREFQNSENITEHSNEEVRPFNQDESHRYNLNCNSVGNTEMEGSKGIGTSQRAKSSTTCDAHNNSVRSSNVMRSADDLRVMHKPAIQNIVDKISLSPAHQKESSITRAGCIKKRTREPNSCPETKTTHTPSSGTTTTHTPSSGTTMTHTLSPGTMTTRTSRILGSSSKSRQDAPKKPARNSQRKPSLRSLEQDQEPCTAHGIPLNLYCGKCREVMCQECTVHHQEAHRVLNTPDALATLRTEAVTLLRHYMILKSLHDTLIQVYTKYIKYSTQSNAREAISSALRIKECVYIAEVVQEAQEVVASGRNLKMIRERLKEWEEHQHDWNDLVYLSLRCTLFASIVITDADKVYLRMGDWVMPIPWVHLSHLLLPYLGEIPPLNKDVLQVSPYNRRRRRSPSPGHGRPCGGATDQAFPGNARNVVVSTLVPYIIFNPDIRYFIQVSDHDHLDVTMIMVPSEEHIKEYLKRRRRSTMSPAAPRGNGFTPSEDSHTLVEKQLMVGGRYRTKLVSYYSTSRSPSTPSTQTVVKVSLPDVKVVDGGHGLPAATGGIKRGDVLVDYDSSGRPNLCVAVRDMGDIPALRLGHVILGLDGLTCLVGAEDTRKTENSGFRAKIMATVRREIEMVYQVTIGMDL